MILIEDMQVCVLYFCQEHSQDKYYYDKLEICT